MDELIVREPTRDETWFAARMTQVQFNALACRLDPETVQAELRTLLKTRRIQRGATCDDAEVSKWLVNGWSTEQILHTNSIHLAEDALRHSLHWAFPQAYYSVYAVTLAYFKAVGYTESSHTAVIRKFGNDVLAGRYPPVLGCTAGGGGTTTYTGLARTRLDRSLDFDPADRELVDGQIAQFLGATRDLDLGEKKRDVPIRTKRGGRKKAFSPADWDRVSEALGATSILSLLYRKRIKANYRDIDSLLSEGIEPDTLYQHLLRIVAAINFIHEVFLARALTCDFLEAVSAGMPEGMRAQLQRRLPRVRSFASA